jgi:hypothetical protein
VWSFLWIWQQTTQISAKEEKGYGKQGIRGKGNGKVRLRDKEVGIEEPSGIH